MVSYLINLGLFGWAVGIVRRFYDFNRQQWLCGIAFLSLVTFWVRMRQSTQHSARVVLVRIIIAGYLLLLTTLSFLYLRDTLIFLFTLVASYFLGRFLLHFLACQTNSIWERTVLSLSIGLVLYALLVLSLGLLSLLYPIYFVVCQFIVIISGLVFFKELPRWSTAKSQIRTLEQYLASSNAATAFALILLSFFVIATIWNFLPPISSDDLWCYLAAPKRFALAHQVYYLPDIPLSNTPFVEPMLYTHGLVWGSLIYRGLVNMIFAFLLLGACLLFGRRFFHPISGLLAFLFLFSIPAYIRHSFYGTFDVRFLLYSILSLYALGRWRQTNELAWLRVSGAMAGGMLGFRWTGMFVASFILLAIGLYGCMAEDHRMSMIVRRFASFLWPMLLIGFPWYLKSWIYTGNPLFPACVQWRHHFYGYLGDEEIGRGYYQYGHSASAAVFGILGFGTSWGSFWRFPWYVTFVGGSYEGYRFTPIYLALAPMVFWKKQTETGRWLIAFCILYTVTWFFSFQMMKFLMPAFGLFGFLCADALLTWKSSLWPRLTHRVLLIGALYICAEACAQSYVPAFFKESIPTALRVIDNHTFLNKYAWEQDLIDAVNKRVPPNGKLFSFNYQILFYIDRPYILGTASIEPVDFRRCPTDANFLALLKELGVTHIILPKKNVLGVPQIGPYDAARYLLFKQIDLTRMRILFENDDYRLAEILYPANLPRYDDSQRFDPVALGDVLLEDGELDEAILQYEKAQSAGNLAISDKLNRLKSMSHLERGDFYLAKAEELKTYQFLLKAALDEYELVSPQTVSTQLLRDRKQKVHDYGERVAPHIWGHLQTRWIS